MLLMVKKGIRGGVCHAINRYEKANNKYMKNSDKNKESSYLDTWNVKNLYGCVMSQESPEFEVQAQYSEKLHELHNHLRVKKSKSVLLI